MLEAAQGLVVVADAVGGDSLLGLLNALRPEGRYVVTGAIAGPSVGLDLRTVYLTSLEIIGSTNGSREDFADLLRYVTDGRVRLLLGQRRGRCHQGQI